MTHLIRRISVLTAFVLFFSLNAIAQPLGIDFKQWANDDLQWINSILQQNNSTYYEGTSSLQRIAFANIQANIPSPDGWYELEVAHQALKGGIHAYDFITGYDQACLDYIDIVGSALCPSDPSGANIGPQVSTGFVLDLYNGSNTILVTPPTPAAYVTNGGQSVADRVTAYDAIVGGSAKRSIQMYGSAPIDSAELVFTGYDNPAAQDNYATYLLRWKSPSDSILILLGGHLAISGDGTGLSYGPGLGSSSISGGPYHFKLFSLNGVSLGAQDNQIKGADILVPPLDSCAVSGPDPVCIGSTNEYSVATDAANPSYEWTVSGNGTIVGADTNATVFVLADSAGSFTVSVTITDNSMGGGSTSCDLTVNIPADPTCSISRSSGSGDFCPGDTSTFCGPAGLADYDWSISGNGAITGPTNGQCVFVTAGSTCGASFTLTLTITDDNGCTSTCEETYGVNDTTDPAFTFVPADFTANCDANPQFGTPTATDDCGTANISSIDTTYGFCPTYKVRTWTATDACGNTATASQTITVVDTTAPNITGVGADATIQCPATPQFSTPGAQDDCDGANLSYVDDTTQGACLGEYSITRTWTATDSCGNSSMASQTISVEDTTAPEITGIGQGETIECPATPQFSEPGATDECSGASLSYEDDTTAGPCPNTYTITRTWTATDSCGNSSSGSQSITVQDNADPYFTSFPADDTLACNASPSFGTPTADDDCGGAALSFEDDTTANGCLTLYARTWTATDSCGNSVSQTQTISVPTDTERPTISGVGAGETINCPAEPQFSSPSATDNCGTPNLTFEDDTTQGNCAGTYSITRTWTATDMCGNDTTASQTITVQDTTSPEITGVGSDATIQCPATPQFSNPNATDECSGASLSYVDDTTAGACLGEYSITRTWTATDSCGNTSMASQTISVEDTTAPEITGVGNDMTIDCPDTPQFSTPNATDECSGADLTYADDTTAGSCFGTYSITRTWTATDSCGNESTASQTISVQDTTDPYFTFVPADDTLACNAALVFGTPTATDDCSGARLSYEDDTTGSCLMVYTRTWTATDSCGNTATASQTISIPTDTDNPVITGVGANDTIDCPATPQFSSPNATDNCGTPSLTYVDDTTAGPCAGTYSITRTWTATDDCGNDTTASQTISVQDTTAPEITGVGDDETLQCPDTPQFSTPSATDECSGADLTYEDDTTNLGCVGHYSITRTWTATDSCGNESTASQTITVEDTTAPEITGVGNDMTIDCPDSPQFSTPNATDECSGADLTYADDTTAGSCFGTYSITRTWTATDSCGNESTASQTISVQDTTDPYFTFVPADDTLACNAALVFGTPTATDDCSGASLSYEDDTTGSCLMVYTRTWTATDSCGNTATASQTISIPTDLDNPVISGVGADETINCPASPQFSSPNATDNCGTPSLTYVDDTTAGPCAGTYSITRTWTATDDCGNDTTASQTISVQDTTAPEITGVGADATIQCPASPEFSMPFATDECAGAMLTYEDDTTQGACLGEYSVTRTWTATDSCGNMSTASQTISVEDTTAPEITGIGDDETLSCPDTPQFSEPGASDLCSGADLSYEDDTTAGPCEGTYSITRTWTATDSCGNMSMGSQTISVVDTTAPELFGCDDVEFCDDQTVEFDLPTATDACDDSVEVVHTRSDGLALDDPYPVGITTITSKATDNCGNETECTFTVTIDAFCDLCGLTQGFYGNEGGKYCDTSTTDLLISLLDSPLVIGYGPRSFTIDSGDAACVILRLPGGKKAIPLTDSSSCSNPIGVPLDADGRIENNLLSQTITLGLNLRLSVDLDDYRLDSIGVSPKIMNYLGPNATVGDLYQLANDALAGLYIPGPGEPNLGHITGALGNVNDEAHYKCRCPDGENFFVRKSDGSEYQWSYEEEQVELRAYPNPTAGNTTIEFSIPDDQGRVTLDLYNATGVRVSRLFEGSVEAGQVFKFNVAADLLPSGIYLYRLNTNSEAHVGKLIVITQLSEK